MLEFLVEKGTLPEAYHSALCLLAAHGCKVPCPSYNTETKEFAMTMVVDWPLKEPRISRLFPGGPDDLEQYRQEMLDGILDFEVDAGKWAYTYHQRIAEQIPLVIEELERDPFSRRAVIDVRGKRDEGSNDPACLQHIQYTIRDGLLDCFVLFRSNDAVKATFMNAFALICLQEKIAKELDVEVGTYTHRANSFHAYKKDWTLLDSYADSLYQPWRESTYRYKGDWDYLMDEAKPGIAEKVRKLKKGKQCAAECGEKD